MIEELEKNIDAEIEMLREISMYTRRLQYVREHEKRLLLGAIQSLRESMRIINKSIPSILRVISVVKVLPSTSGPRKSNKYLEHLTFTRIDSQVDVVLSSRDKVRFIKELDINDRLLRKLKKKQSVKEEKHEEFKASRGYLKLANRVFLERAGTLVKQGHFKSLSISLKKANIDILFEAYVAMIFLTVFLFTFLSVFLTTFLLFVDVSFSWPVFEIYTGDYLARFLRIFWITLVVPPAVFLAIYFYPSTEWKSLSRGINQELPFSVIHMNAISGSGIEPSEIFRIIGSGKEYPHLAKEIRKVLNQINLYGYDLVTSLNNAAKTSPSEELSELFSGISTTITSGANLSEFLEKRSEGLLLNYRLEREKYTRLVETFLDIYISMVIAAPMVFLLLFIMMAISGIEVGFSSAQLSIVSVVGIAILNIFFLLFLQIKQPSY